MGKIIIQEETTKNPVTLIGKEAGICYGTNITNENDNYKRGLDCLKSNHGRTLEFPQVYLIVDGFSAKFAREFYTHIGGSPTRLQSSTRYINYQRGFSYITPHTISNNEKTEEIYREAVHQILYAMQQLDELGVPREDSSMLMPLSYISRFVVRTNLRNLIDMSHQRECTRAYWEYRDFMRDLKEALSDYSPQWKYIVDNYFKPKCELFGYCNERKSCGRKPKMENK